MRKILLKGLCLGLAFFSLSSEVQAGDACNEKTCWDGFYVGAHAGYGWGEARWNTVSGNQYTHDVDGALGGIQLGYNLQNCSFVYGPEASISWAGIDGKTTWSSGSRDGKVDFNWLATIAGRAGWLMNDTLLFMKGGMGLAGIDYRHLSANGVRTGDATRIGWLIGLGVEHAFNEAWSALMEFNHMDFGSKGITMRVSGSQDRVLSVNQHLSVFKVGVNYSF